MVENCCYNTDLAERHEFSDMPKGDWLVFATNPYNGRMFVKVKGKPSAFVIASDVVRDVAEKLCKLDGLLGRRADMSDYFDLCEGRIEFDEFVPCPFCGEKPSYDSESHELTCCEGHLKLYDFSDRKDAMRFWNGRNRRVA